MKGDITGRPVQGRRGIGKLGSVIKGRRLSIEVKTDLRNCIILSTRVFGSEMRKIMKKGMKIDVTMKVMTRNRNVRRDKKTLLDSVLIPTLSYESTVRRSKCLRFSSQG